MRTSCSCSWISSQTAYYFLQDRNKTPDWARASLPHWHFVAVNKNWFSNLLLLTVTIHLRAGRVESKRSHSISPREVKQLSKIHSNGFVAEQDQGRSPRFPRHCPSALVFQIILIINIANIFSALPSTERCSWGCILLLSIYTCICNNSKEAQCWNSFFQYFFEILKQIEIPSFYMYLTVTLIMKENVCLRNVHWQ